MSDCGKVRPIAVRGLEIDREREFGRFLDRQLARPRTAEDLIDIGGGAAKDIRIIGRIGHQPAAGT